MSNRLLYLSHTFIIPGNTPPLASPILTEGLRTSKMVVSQNNQVVPRAHRAARHQRHMPFAERIRRTARLSVPGDSYRANDAGWLSAKTLCGSAPKHEQYWSIDARSSGANFSGVSPHWMLDIRQSADSQRPRCDSTHGFHYQRESQFRQLFRHISRGRRCTFGPSFQRPMDPTERHSGHIPRGQPL